MTPQPYIDRFEFADVPIDDTPDGLRFSIPPVEVLYPGEQANIAVEVDRDELVARCTISVSKAPGARMRLLRFRYRLRRLIGGAA